MALALARKYRPRTFADVAVQSHVANTLKGAIARGRVAHGYLLCGPRGVGKTTLARVLAMALNCEAKRDDGEPCGACASCTRIWGGATSLDVVEIDAASNRGVDDARELRERAMYAPTADDRYKVYIVDEAHMLTREAWNALLKILEEPPPRVVFVFATTEPQKIAQAAAPVLSRLQRFDFKRIGPADIRARLQRVLDDEGVPADGDALAMLARAADGSMRDALSLTDQVLALGDTAVTAPGVRAALGLVPDDEYLALLDLVAERRAGDVFPAVARLGDLGVDFAQLVNGLAELLRAQLAIALGGTPADLPERTRVALEERQDRLAPGDLVRMLTLLVETEPRIRRSAQQQLLVETLLVRFALLDRTVELEAVLRGLGEVPAAAPASARSVAPGGGGGAARGGGWRAEAARVLEDVAGAGATAAPGLAAEVVAPLRAPAAPSPAPAPPLADEPVRAAPPAPAELPRLVERWDDVVADLRAAGRGVVAALLERALPHAVTAQGVVTVEAADPADARGLDGALEVVRQALQARFTGITKVMVRTAGETAAPPQRFTADGVRSDRLAALRRRDPVLDAAVQHLDLDLVD
jgi:DNA polymerase-3 subunit gamma/tau